MRHITFANEYYQASAAQLVRSSRSFALTSNVYTQADLPASFYSQHQKHFQESRGFGYWIWKPFIILKYLEESPIGEVVLYTDAGCEFINDPHLLLPTLKYQDVVPFELFDITEDKWTKHEVFQELRVASEIRNTWQRCSGYILLRNTNNSRQLIKEWYTLCSRFDLVNDITKYRKLIYHHRHDQSLFSVLTKLEGLQAYPDPSNHGILHPGRQDLSYYPTIINNHRKNNLPIGRKIKRSIIPKLSRIFGI